MVEHMSVERLNNVCTLFSIAIILNQLQAKVFFMLQRKGVCKICWQWVRINFENGEINVF